MMPQGVETFSTRENLILRAFIFRLFVRPSGPLTQVATFEGRITPKCDLLYAKQVADARKIEAAGTRSPGRVLKSSPLYRKVQVCATCFAQSRLHPNKRGATCFALARKHENHQILWKVKVQSRSHSAASQSASQPASQPASSQSYCERVWYCIPLSNLAKSEALRSAILIKVFSSSTCCVSRPPITACTRDPEGGSRSCKSAAYEPPDVPA